MIYKKQFLFIQYKLLWFDIIIRTLIVKNWKKSESMVHSIRKYLFKECKHKF